MATTLTVLKKLLNDQAIDLIEELTDTSDGNERVCYQFDAGPARLKVYAHIINDGRLLQIYAYPAPHHLGPLTPAIVERLQGRVAEFNDNFRYGRWTLDSDGDGCVNFGLFLEDSELTARQLARIHFILRDLVLHQAQILQLDALLPAPAPSYIVGLTATAVMAAVQHPSLVRDICRVLRASNAQAEALHAAAGVAYDSTPLLIENDEDEITPRQMN